MHDLRTRGTSEQSVFGGASFLKYMFCPIWILVYLLDSLGV
jgi:hypothetical protein